MKYHRLLQGVGLAAMLAVLALLVLPAPARAEAPLVTVECDETADISKQQRIDLTVDITGPAADYISVDWEVVEFDRSQYVLTDSTEEPGTTHWETSCWPEFGTEGCAYVYVWWRDGTEKHIEKHFTLTGGVKPAQDLTVEAKLDQEKVELGQEIALDFSATGGVGSYTYEVFWSTENASDFKPENNRWSGEYIRSTFIAQGGSSGEVTVTVWDSMRRNKTVTLPFQIETYGYPPIVLGDIVLSDYIIAVDQGQSVTASWSAEGGSGDLVYKYMWRVFESGTVSSIMQNPGDYVNETNTTFTPKFGDSCWLDVSVHDVVTCVDVSWKTIEITLTGGGTPRPLELEVKLDNPPAVVGKPARISWTASGGDGGNLYSAELSLWNVDESYLAYEGSLAKDLTDTSLTYIPEVAGKTAISVEATDKLGRRCFGTVYFFVEKSSDVGPFLPGDADKDGKLTIKDVTSIVDYAAANIECASPGNAEVDGNGEINVWDAEWVIQQIVN